MKMTMFVLLLGACAPEPAPPVPTWEDAITAVAEAQCSKWIECGALTDEGWQDCVEQLTWDTCQRVLDTGRSCLSAYPGDYDLVVDCAAWYASVDCRTYVTACHI